MKILVACEYSGIVSEAFYDKGHDVTSCDVLHSESNLINHYQGDVLEILDQKWDMMIAFPPCTHLSFAGTRSWNDEGKVFKRLEALNFFAQLWTADIDKICIENPKGCASPTIKKYDQIIQPYYWGDPVIKTTCLWLKNLPKLTYKPINSLFGSTEVKPESYHVDSSGKREKTNRRIKKRGLKLNSFGTNDQHERSRFWKGIANAMAEQWG